MTAGNIGKDKTPMGLGDEKIVLNGDVPKFMKLIMLFIDRVGFPTLAFILMFWQSHVGIAKMTTALETNSIVITEFQAVTKDFQNGVVKDHLKMFDEIDKIKTYSYGWQDYIQGRRR